MTKQEAEKAYKAGRALVSVDWSAVEETVPPEKRGPGVEHCPFAEGDPQRIEWLRGLRDALGEPRPDPRETLKEIDKELGGEEE